MFRLRNSLVLLLALSAAHCASFLSPADEATLSFTGNVELKEVALAFKRSGRLVELKFEEGEFLQAGDLVGKLENEELLRQKEQALAQVQSAESRLEELRALVRFQRENVDAQIAEARGGLREAEAALERLLAGSRRTEIEAARASVQRAVAEFEKASSDWARAQELYGKEDISTSQFEQFRAAHAATEAQLKQVREQAALVEEGARKEDIEMARATVDRARARVRLAQSQQLDITRNERARETLKAEIESARARLAVHDSQLADTELYSPISGVVLSKNVEVGEVLAAGTPMLSAGDLDRPWIRGYILEADLGRVRLGDQVEVTTDSYPGRVYSGRVSFIASEAEFTPKQIQTPEERVKLVYRVKVEIDNLNQELKLNMPVSCRIMLGGAGQVSPAGEDGDGPAPSVRSR